MRFKTYGFFLTYGIIDVGFVIHGIIDMGFVPHEQVNKKTH